MQRHFDVKRGSSFAPHLGHDKTICLLRLRSPILTAGSVMAILLAARSQAGIANIALTRDTLAEIRDFADGARHIGLKR